jgi:hypothetical protein
VPEAPLTPEDRDSPANDGDDVPRLSFGHSGADPVAPWGDRRPFVRFAAGLSRQHGWRLILARLVAFAILLGVVLFVLAEFVRN